MPVVGRITVCAELRGPQCGRQRATRPGAVVCHRRRTKFANAMEQSATAPAHSRERNLSAPPSHVLRRSSSVATVKNTLPSGVVCFYKLRCSDSYVMNHGPVTPEIAAGLLALKSRIEAAKIPPSKIDETINVTLWNIRGFGKVRRMESVIHYIAEILGQFGFSNSCRRSNHVTHIWQRGNLS